MGQRAYDKREGNDRWMEKQRGKVRVNGGNVMKMEERWVKEESDGGKECERWIGTLGIKINCRRK